MNIIGENLKRIRLLKNLSLKEAGKLLNMSDTMIMKYEQGKVIPNSTKLIEFADGYKVNALDFLEHYSPVKMQFTNFRKRKSLTGKKLELLKDLIQREVSKYIEVLKLNSINLEKLKLETYVCSTLEDCENAALKFRQNIIKISNILPISDLTSILENLGIIIVNLKNLDERFKDFDGFSEIVDGIPVIVLPDNINDGARQRFTIAHELGHLVLKFKDNMIDIEKLCNRFASALLMPKEVIFHEFGRERYKISFYELEAFKNEYKVSISSIVYRLHDLNIISDYFYKNMCIKINKIIDKNDKHPVSKEISYQFKKIVHKLQIDDIISLSKALELLGVSQDEYNIEENYCRY